MKKLIITLLVLSPFFCSAQNWQSVRMNDTTYYTIPAANDYLRVIWIDSATTSGTDTVFHFYPSVRLDYDSTNPCLNMSGATWLGKKFIKQANGDELFYNYLQNPILLKPHAALNSTWTIFTEPSTNYVFRGTVTLADTMTIDGMLDSFKVINIEVFNGTTPVVNHMHFNRGLVLSKSNGLLECLEWYCFPFDQTNFPNNSVYGKEHFTPQSETHYRVSNKFNYESFYNKVQENAFYKQGNARLIYYGFGQFSGQSYVYDSIIATTIIGPNQLEVIIYKETVTVTTTPVPQQPPTVSYSRKDTTYTQVLPYQNLNNAPPIMQDSILPEFALQPNKTMVNYNYGIANYPSYTLKPSAISCFNFLVSQTMSTSPYIDTPNGCNSSINSLSGYQSIKTNWYLPFQKTSEYYHELTTNSLVIDYSRYGLIYLKLDSCTHGAMNNFFVLSAGNYSVENHFNIYPNPAHNKIHFTPKDNSKILSVKLFSIQGKQIATCENCTELSTAAITNGLYILNIETDKGTLRKKIVVEH